MENYTVIGKIGGGAEGIVFRVRHEPTKKEFAMKVIRCPDHSRVNSALKEIKVLLHLRHRHVVSYVDFFLLFHNDTIRHEFVADYKNEAQLSESTRSLGFCSTGCLGSNGSPVVRNEVLSDVFCFHPSEVCVCLVMALCTSGDMQDTIEDARRRLMEVGSHPIPEAQILSWMEQCASALAFIHEQGFLHRDLKPTNVFFDDDKEIKIGDFGLAATVGLGRQSIVGTPFYLAPERMLHQVYDEKVDVWGLGVVMLELVTLQDQPINSRVLENPLVVESVVEQVTSMGFSSKLGGLLRDMLQRFPEGRPSPAAILCRLASMKATASPHCSISIPIPSAGMSCPKFSTTSCEFYEVESATLACSHCGTALLEGCDCARDKHHSRQGHERFSLIFSRNNQKTRAHALNDVEVNTLPPENCKTNCSKIYAFSRPNLPVFNSIGGSICGTSTEDSSNILIRSMKSTIIRVPQDYPTIATALHSAQSMPHVRKIVVAGNTIHSTPLTLDDKLPDNLKLIGENPSPVVEVNAATFAVHCTSGRGTLENFIIRHAGGRISPTDSHTDEQDPKKTLRPMAISIAGGEWKITRCRISCSAGSGISVAAGVEAIVSHCIILEVKLAGIVVLEGGQGLFEKNKFTNCGFAAFLLKKNSSARLFGNHLTDGAETGIFCQDASGLVEDNFIANNGGCGVVAKGSDAKIILRGNRVVANGQAGFFCCDGASPIITDNEIRQNKRAGVLVKTRASPRIAKNVISCGREAGIYVFEGGAGFIEENEVRDNSNAGVLVTTGGRPHVVRNTIRGSLYEGVWVCKNGGGTFFENDLRCNEKGPKDIEKGCSVVWIGNRES
ncbi:protein kinase [Trypanosoma cruzi cruzi]|nr:protein kinase [Trypanosoma cruzi cruzi]